MYFVDDADAIDPNVQGHLGFSNKIFPVSAHYLVTPLPDTKSILSIYDCVISPNSKLSGLKQ